MESVIPKIVFNMKRSTKNFISLLNHCCCIIFLLIFYFLFIKYVQTSISLFGLNIDSPNSFDPRQRRQKLVHPFLCNDCDGLKYLYKFITLLPKDYYLIPSNNAMKLVCCVPYLLY